MSNLRYFQYVILKKKLIDTQHIKISLLASLFEITNIFIIYNDVNIILIILIIICIKFPIKY